LRQIFGLSGVGWIKITRNQNKQKNKLKNPIQNEVERKTWKNIQKGKKKTTCETNINSTKGISSKNQVKNEWIVGSGS